MNTNSTRSFIYNVMVFYIIVPMIAIIILFCMWMLGMSPGKENLALILSTGQWYIVSVAVVLAAKIIDDGFKEREVNINEMKAFEAHSAIITAGYNLTARYKLAEFFSIVTPEGKLQEGWEKYRQRLEEEYEYYSKLETERIALMEQKSRSKQQKDDLKEIESEIERIDKKYATSVIP